MDGYHTKPILPETLLAAIEKYLRPAPVTTVRNSDEQMTKLSPLVEGYLRRMREYTKAVEQYVDEGSWDQVIVIGHNLKGTGGTYGFDELSTIGLRLEAAAKGRNKPLVAAINAELLVWLASF